MKTLWHDPVWSNVIGGVILAVVLAIGAHFLPWWPIMAGLLLVKIPLIFLIAAVFAAGLAGYLPATLRAPKRSLDIEKSDHRPKFDRVFEPNDSVKFYAEIADQYDVRNTEELLQTHRAVVTEIEEHVKSRETALVLDLGGGTGRGIADHFFNYTQVKWVYVDACGRMAEKFRENLAEVPLRTEVHVMTLAEAYAQFAPGETDVIVMSFLISSLPERPNFSKVSRLLREDGIFIVADADPAYSRISPYYDFRTSNGSIALKVNPIHQLELKDLCESSGLRECAVHPVKKRGLIYSYIAVFERGHP
jgi:ubiquinone/menaquinone biosynthesis C-methylase UbiE